MAGTFSQIHLHLVFAVSGRQSLIDPEFENDLYRYMSGIIENKNQKPLIIGGMPDHVHILLSLKPAMAPADLVRDLKNNSSRYVKEKSRADFSWQEGYGIFSCSHSQLNSVHQYIRNQKEHHRQKSFREEYTAFLQKYQITHDQAHLFEWLDG
jgi:putative transposase